MSFSSLLRSSRPRFLAALALVSFAATIVLIYRPQASVGDETAPLTLQLKHGDRISLIGNSLGERMQHDGWLETYFQSRFPKHNLSFRNLCFPGDELTIRLRSANFGSPEDWLKKHETDVVFAFFGYNESFGDKAGLAKFESDLKNFLKQTKETKFNGKTEPRVVLFSPIAHENLKDPNLPDGSENNRRIAMYTAAMAKIARENRVVFVDLYQPTTTLYSSTKQPLTINGIHLNTKGNEEIAKIIDNALFQGKPEGSRESKAMETLRKAVVDKNHYWYQRYRTTDGYSVYGGRSGLQFVGGQTNRVVAQREMEVLDVMTANRDKRIWAIARGTDIEINDANTPPFIDVKTNKPGSLQGGKHLFLDPEKAIDRMKVAKGMKVNLFASEKQFPELVNPVQMTFDTKGRLWVAVWPTYPHWKPKEPMNDKILVLEDTNGDGKADTCKVFADNLHCPTGFELWNGGVLIAQAPNLWFLKDTDGDGKADYRERVISGIDSADTHHASNSFVLDPGGAVYFQEGTFHHSQAETPYGPPTRLANAGVFRYEPRTQKFDVYVTYGFANPHGHIFTRWGQDIVIDGTGSNPYHAALFSGRLDFPQKHGRPPSVWQPRTRPCPGMEVMSSRHFPPDMQGHVLVANVIGFQGILRYKLNDDGSSFSATEQEPMLSSSDPNFRPTDLRVGPDGAVYIIDWHNPIIGHMQHNLRDPSRDREHGRIYRVTYSGRELLKPVKIAGESIEKLLDLLKEPEDRVRYRARIELTAQPSEKVVAATRQWVAGLNPKDAEFEHHLLEALWLHQSHNVVDPSLLNRVLAAKNFEARAAATRVLCYWRDRIPNALDLLRKLAADEHPRVRLEAVRAASFFNEPEAVEVVLIASEKPTDRYIDYLRGETMKALQPVVRKAIADGKKIAFKTTVGARYFLRTVPTEDLLKLERSQPVYLELLFRPGVRDEFRREALMGLAKIEKQSQLKVLLSAIHQHDDKEVDDEESLGFDLVRLINGQTTIDLAANRAELETLATKARKPLTRQLGYVALIAADKDTSKAWALGVKSVRSLQDLLNAVPMISDPGQRSGLFAKVEGLLKGLPKELAAGAGAKSVMGRYVRVELPGRQRTLTLAEVEVISDWVNVARRGKAKQSSTAHGGDASRGIDGNKSGTYGDGGQTHSREGEDNPWWEVDLGNEYPIETIMVYNRTDGALGTRLRNYTLKVLDHGRNVVFQKAKNPVPNVKADFAVGTMSPERTIRRAAMRALPSMRGQEAETVKAVAVYVKDDVDRPAAVGALQRIPPRFWTKEAASPVLDDLLKHIRKVPASERTNPVVLDELQLAHVLAGLLPVEDGKKVRKELNELGVRVIRLGTVIEQMIYDRERIVVQAGKQVEINFENTDTMPHNFVIIEPGSLEEIGNLAETTATDPKAAARHYVPVSKKVMLASQLIQPRQSQRLSFVAPKKPGVYPYVCTYPGHWRRMHGALYVVADLEAYEAGPEAYLAKNPLPIADPLLKFNRPRTEWKLADLTTFAQHLEGRSFTNGRQMFTVGACISCHKMEGKGQEFGPDLLKLDPKWKPIDVLQHMLDPSLKIDDKYRVWTFELTSGKVVTGMILEENKEVVKVIENPLAAAKPLMLKVKSISERKKSPTSLMPKGLLDKMTRDEILDLLAYVVSGGNGKHKVFQGGHDHGAHGHKH